MARWVIPEADGHRVARGVTDVVDASNTFGNRIENPVRAVDPSADAFGLPAAKAAEQTAKVIAGAGDNIGRALQQKQAADQKRAALLQQAEEKSQAKLGLTKYNAAAEEAIRNESSLAKDMDLSAEELNQNINTRLEELNYNTTSQFTFKTNVGDEFASDVENRAIAYRNNTNQAGGVIEQHRVHRAKNNLSTQVEVARQKAAADGSLEGTMAGVEEQRSILLSDETGVIAYGSLEGAQLEFTKQRENMYVDNIQLQLERDPDHLVNLLETKTGDNNDKEFSYYPNLNPQTRAKYVSQAKAEIKRRDKEKDANLEAVRLIDSHDVSKLPLRTSEVKKINKYIAKTRVHDLKDLPQDQRYSAMINDAVKLGFVPKVYLDEIKQNVHSPNTLNQGEGLKIASRMLSLNPRLKKDLGEEVALAAYLHTASGYSPEKATEVAEANLVINSETSKSRNKVYDKLAREDNLTDENVSYFKNYLDDTYEDYSTGFLMFKDTAVVSDKIANVYNTTVRAEYARTGNLDYARKTAAENMGHVYRPTKQNGTLEMAMNPLETYFSGEALDTVKAQMHTEIKDNFNLEPDQYILIGDSVTAMQGQDPSWVVWKRDEDGNPTEMLRDKGSIIRISPSMDSLRVSIQKEQEDAKAARRKERKLNKDAMKELSKKKIVFPDMKAL